MPTMLSGSRFPNSKYSTEKRGMRYELYTITLHLAWEKCRTTTTLAVETSETWHKLQYLHSRAREGIKHQHNCELCNINIDRIKKSLIWLWNKKGKKMKRKKKLERSQINQSHPQTSSCRSGASSCPCSARSTSSRRALSIPCPPYLSTKHHRLEQNKLNQRDYQPYIYFGKKKKKRFEQRRRNHGIWAQKTHIRQQNSPTEGDRKPEKEKQRFVGKDQIDNGESEETEAYLSPSHLCDLSYDWGLLFIRIRQTSQRWIFFLLAKEKNEYIRINRERKWISDGINISRNKEGRYISDGIDILINK